MVLASSALIEGTTMQLPPVCQSAGVATFFVAVSCRESMTRRISLKGKLFSILKSCNVSLSLLQATDMNKQYNINYYTFTSLPILSYFLHVLSLSYLLLIFQSSNHTDLLKVTSSGGRVKDGQFQLLVRSNDKDGPTGERHP